MFEYFVIPGGVFVVGFLVSLIIVGLSIFGIKVDTEKSGEPFPIVFAIASPLFFLVLGGLIISMSGGMLSINGSKNTDDPSVVKGAISVFNVNEENMQKRIEKEADLSNVELESNNKSEMAETLQSGKFVEFIADKKDKSTTKGFTYFKNGEMIIVVDENLRSDKIVVPVK